MRLPTPTPSSLSPTQGSGSLRKIPFPNKLPPFQSRSRTFSRFRFPRLKLFLLLLFFKRHSILLSNANIWESGNLLRSDRNKLQRSSIQRNKPERESSATEKKIGIKFRLRTEKNPKNFFHLSGILFFESPTTVTDFLLFIFLSPESCEAFKIDLNRTFSVTISGLCRSNTGTSEAKSHLVHSSSHS